MEDAATLILRIIFLFLSDISSLLIMMSIKHSTGFLFVEKQIHHIDIDQYIDHLDNHDEPFTTNFSENSSESILVDLDSLIVQYEFINLVDRKLLNTMIDNILYLNALQFSQLVKSLSDSKIFRKTFLRKIKSNVTLKSLGLACIPDNLVQALGGSSLQPCIENNATSQNTNIANQVQTSPSSIPLLDVPVVSVCLDDITCAFIDKK